VLSLDSAASGLPTSETAAAAAAAAEAAEAATTDRVAGADDVVIVEAVDVDSGVESDTVSCDIG
jgi:hypothetical protein